jgi:hypothetical protein
MEQKHRDEEAKLIKHAGQNQWECMLYVFPFSFCFSLFFFFSLLLLCLNILMEDKIFVCEKWCRPNGMTFVASPNTTVTKWPLKPGDIVTFKFRGFWLGSGKPKSPTIYRVRTDKTWEEVVSSFKQNTRIPTGVYLFNFTTLEYDELF